MPITLYHGLQASYGNKASIQKLDRDGYHLDHSLSNGNEQVYYNNKKHKLLYSVAGTHNISDIGTDVYLGLGLIKRTNRYKEAENVLKEAKSKYNINNATIIGSSLGGNIAGYISSTDDRVLTHNKGASFFQPVRSNETHFRNNGDLVSIANANSTHTTNLPNPNIHTGNIILDAFNAHSIQNIKNERIFI